MFRAIKEGHFLGPFQVMSPFGDKLTNPEIKALVDYMRKLTAR